LTVAQSFLDVRDMSKNKNSLERGTTQSVWPVYI
jgi:hypothetical protein